MNKPKNIILLFLLSLIVSTCIILTALPDNRPHESSASVSQPWQGPLQYSEVSDPSTDIPVEPSVAPVPSMPDPPTSIDESEVSEESEESDPKHIMGGVSTAPEEPQLDIEAMKQKYDMTRDAQLLSKILYRECGIVKSKTEQACVVWTVLNRVDASKGRKNIYQIITAKHQFAWVPNTPIKEDLLELAYDVLARWYFEKETGISEGRVLPKDYLYFYGDGRHNYFHKDYTQKKVVWDYSLPSPYTT